MKTYLLPILIIFAFSNAIAQQPETKERFAFISISFDEAYKIKIDSGQAPFTKKGPFLADSIGNVLKFVSVGAALNYMGTTGWKLQSVLPDIDNTYAARWMYIRTGYIYLFKKEF